jgi:PST family polysaccharide transporter
LPTKFREAAGVSRPREVVAKLSARCRPWSIGAQFLRVITLRSQLATRAHILIATRGVRHSALLVFERVLRLVLATGLSIYAARRLGPFDFGILAYAQSLMVLVTALATLGLPEITMREMAQRKTDRDILALAAFVSRLSGAALALAIALLVAVIDVGPHDQSIPIVLIIVAGLLFQAGEAFEWRLIAAERIPTVVIIRITTTLVASALKLWLLLVRPDVALFAALITLEFGLACLFQLLVGSTAFHHVDWQRVRRRARELVVICLPMFVRSGVIAIYLRIDQLAISWTYGKAELGIYAAAARLVEVWFFLPSAVMLVFAPRLAVLYVEDRPAFDRQLTLLLRIGGGAAALFALALGLVATPLVEFLFGDAFARSAPLLLILGISTIAGTVGAISNVWFVNSGQLRTALWQAVVALMIAAALYALLVPLYGAKGAAFAYCITQFTLNIVLIQISSRTRPIALLQRSALLRWRH